MKLKAITMQQILLERSPTFDRSYKKLNKDQKRDIIKAIETLQNNPLIGELKVGDLKGIRVYKFRMVNQLTLMAYDYNENIITLHLLMFGPHENFYDKPKRQMN